MLSLTLLETHVVWDHTHTYWGKVEHCIALWGGQEIARPRKGDLPFAIFMLLHLWSRVSEGYVWRVGLR